MTHESTETTFLYSDLAQNSDYVEIVERFVSVIPARMEAVVEAFESGNYESVRRLAHQLKGSLGSHGFPTLTPIAAELEDAATDPSDTQRVKDSLCELVSMCAALRPGTPDSEA